MAQGRYPEWFIGGPLHGRDKTEHSPTVPEYDRVRHVETLPSEVMADWPNQSGLWTETEWLYRRVTFVFGSVDVPFWTDERLMARSEIESRLGELIMAPHVKDEKDETTEEGTDDEHR